MNSPYPYLWGAAAACMALAGCITMKEPIINYYALEAPVPAGATQSELRVAVQRTEGRAPYRRARMVVSPREFALDTYTASQWMDDPCDMLTDGLVTYLARHCAYVTFQPRVYKDAVRYVVVPYVDAFDHARRGSTWHALMRVKFDIVDDATRAVLHSTWFERNRALPDSSIAAYVAAQNEAVAEYYATVLSELLRLAQPAE